MECSDGAERCDVGALGSAVVGVHTPPGLEVGDGPFDHVTHLVDRGVELFCQSTSFPQAGLRYGVMIPVPR